MDHSFEWLKDLILPKVSQKYLNITIMSDLLLGKKVILNIRTSFIEKYFKYILSKK